LTPGVPPPANKNLQLQKPGSTLIFREIAPRLAEVANPLAEVSIDCRYQVLLGAAGVASEPLR